MPRSADLNHDLLAIVGPTAGGKTDFALEYASRHPAEVISVDSRQVYRDLSVGTAAPRETRGVPHHLIGFLDPRESYSAAAFAMDARALIADIRRRGKEPVLAGGTGFYFRALTEGLAPLPPADPDVRAELKRRAEARGRAALHQELGRVDPEAAARIPANNIQRLIRALEVYRLTGKPLSQWHREHQISQNEPRLRVHAIGLDPGRDELARRISTRCAWMLENGMIEETEAALAAGVPTQAPGLSGVGYPRVIAHIRGELSRAETLRLMIQDTRQYAKRQRTWFRHQMEVEWKTS